MKAFIFDPLWTQLVTNDLLAKLKGADIELIVTEEIAPLSACASLFEGDQPRILSINPDYVGWKLTSDDYKTIPNLKGIFGAATSFSWIDRTYADAQGIPVCNIRNFSTEAVAEWAITMMHNLARQVPRLIKDKFRLDFDKDFMRYRGIELQGKTAGIIGLGNIGSAIAKRCAGLGMKVVYWSKKSRNPAYSGTDLSTLLSQADVIFPTLSDNEDTRKLLTNDLLRTVKSTALLVSVVHGVFDEQLAVDMVNKNQLFGFGFEAKPASFDTYKGNV